MKKSLFSELLDWTLHIAVAVAISLIMVKYVIQVTVIHGESMRPTLDGGDRLVIEKVSPAIGNITYGDIITLYVPEFLEPGKETIIKRVVALENDSVKIQDGKVLVNGKVLDDSFTKNRYTMGGAYDNLVVPKGSIFVMGDNRENSKDSRTIGPVSVDRITGKAVCRFFPLEKIALFSKDIVRAQTK